MVDDDIAVCELVAVALARGFAVETRGSGTDALIALATGEFDVVITDLNMRGMTGIELCRRIVDTRPDIPVVVMTAFGSMQTAIEAIRAGAHDFITKPFALEALVHTVRRAVQHRALRDEVKRLREEARPARPFADILGRSAEMQNVYELMSRVADADTSVLITGESGTGKEGVARALHTHSRRRTGPFVAVNCAAMPETLLESELFGHAKGAFTDARSSHVGLFVQATGGTILLDEIGDMPIGLQPKLLRALQERRVRPVGGSAEVPFDVRVLTATNKDLESAVEEQRFREDLLYRINVIHLELPPLRARGGDVLLLAQHFVERFSVQLDKKVLGIASAAAEKLLAYAWPGNVRELANVIERALVLTRFEHISAEDLPAKIRTFQAASFELPVAMPNELVTMEEVERRYILRALETLGGNRALAAQALGLDRKTLYRKLKRYGARGDSPSGNDEGR